MTSRDIEHEVEKITAMVADLHDYLVANNETAWFSIPAIGSQVKLNGVELEVSIRIGAIEK